MIQTSPCFSKSLATILAALSVLSLALLIVLGVSCGSDNCISSQLSCSPYQSAKFTQNSNLISKSLIVTTGIYGVIIVLACLWSLLP